jgi:hypothetical protein
VIRLGLRLTLAGGREAAVRLVILVAAVGLGVGLLLIAVAGVNAVNTQNDRYAWLSTGYAPTAAGPAKTAADPLWWLIRVTSPPKLGRRGRENRRGALDDQGFSGTVVRGRRHRTGVLVRPLAGIVLRRLAGRPGKTERHADPGAHDDQADRPGDAAPADLAVPRDYPAGQALAGQHVVQLAIQRDPQAELVISADGHGDLFSLRRSVAAAADRGLCWPRT